MLADQRRRSTADLAREVAQASRVQGLVWLEVVANSLEGEEGLDDARALVSVARRLRSLLTPEEFRAVCLGIAALVEAPEPATRSEQAPNAVLWTCMKCKQRVAVPPPVCPCTVDMGGGQ